MTLENLQGRHFLHSLGKSNKRVDKMNIMEEDFV